VIEDPARCLEVKPVPAAGRIVGLPAAQLVECSTGATPRMGTSVRVGLRESALLVRFDARDREVVATLRGRDAPLWTEDVFEVFLSPFDPPRVYFEFEVNPLGALFDARVESPDLSRLTMRVDPSWNCPGFSARVRRRDGLWSALLRIPLAPMARENRAASWRANFYRIDRGDRDEFSAWSPTYAHPPDFHVPERFGTLRLPVTIGPSVHRSIG
jgi:Carbohydrate-binding family 9